jgi:hypothetical protein
LKTRNYSRANFGICVVDFCNNSHTREGFPSKCIDLISKRSGQIANKLLNPSNILFFLVILGLYQFKLQAYAILLNYCQRNVT